MVYPNIEHTNVIEFTVDKQFELLVIYISEGI